MLCTRLESTRPQMAMSTACVPPHVRCFWWCTRDLRHSFRSKHRRKRLWGLRMWNLSEAFLSTKPNVKFCSPFQETEELGKLDIAEQLWDDGVTTSITNQPSRVLAEHYSNVLTRSRIELLSVALLALSHRHRNAFARTSPTPRWVYSITQSRWIKSMRISKPLHKFRWRMIATV